MLLKTRALTCVETEEMADEDAGKNLRQNSSFPHEFFLGVDVCSKNSMRSRGIPQMKPPAAKHVNTAL